MHSAPGVFPLSRQEPAVHNRGIARSQWGPDRAFPWQPDRSGTRNWVSRFKGTIPLERGVLVDRRVKRSSPGGAGGAGTLQERVDDLEGVDAEAVLQVLGEEDPAA